MDNNTQEIRDPKTHRLFGIYYQERGIYEVKNKDLTLQVQFLPGTPVEFIFTDSYTVT